MSRRFQLFGAPRHFAAHAGGIAGVELSAEEEGARLAGVRAEQAARTALYSQMRAEEEERVAPPSPLSSYGSASEPQAPVGLLDDDYTARHVLQRGPIDSDSASDTPIRGVPARRGGRSAYACADDDTASSSDVSADAAVMEEDMAMLDDEMDDEAEDAPMSPGCLMLDTRHAQTHAGHGAEGGTARDGSSSVGDGEQTSPVPPRMSTADPAGDTAEVLGTAQPWDVLRDAGIARIHWLGRGTDPAELRSSTLDVPLPTWRRLYPHQRTGVAWLWRHTCEAAANRTFGAILADEMGLGKTVQMLTFLESVLHNGYGKTGLIVVPSTMVASWQAHQETWCPRLRLTALTADTPLALRARLIESYAHPNHAGVLLTTYGMIQSMSKRDRLLERVHWDYIALDEGHVIKNSSSQTARAAKSLRGNVRFLLTGTPFQNTLDELWALYSFVDAGIFNCSATAFKQTYTDPVRRGLLKGASEKAIALGTQASSELKELYAPFMLQRTKDILPELQQKRKIDVVVWCAMTDLQRKVYSHYVEGQDVKECILRREVPGAICMLTNLRKLCNHLWLQYSQHELHHKVLTPSEGTEQGSIAGDCCKMEVLLRIYEESRTAGHRLLIFSQSAKMLTIITAVLHAVFPDTQLLRLDGCTRPRDRQARVDRFNKDRSIDAMLLTTGVGGMGLSLTGASRVVIYDPDWNPAKDSQAIGRAHRIGQAAQVVVYRLMTCGGVEEYTYRQAIFKECIERKTQHRQNDLRRYFNKVDLHAMFNFNPTATHTLDQLRTLQGEKHYPQDVEAVFDAVRGESSVQGLTDHDAVFDTVDDTAVDTPAPSDAAASQGAAATPQAQARRRVSRKAVLPSETPHAVPRACEDEGSSVLSMTGSCATTSTLNASSVTSESDMQCIHDDAMACPDVAYVACTPQVPASPAAGRAWGSDESCARLHAIPPTPAPTPKINESPTAHLAFDWTPAVSRVEKREMSPEEDCGAAGDGHPNTPPARERDSEVGALFARSSPTQQGGTADVDDAPAGRCYSSSQPRDKDDREMLKAAEEAFSTFQSDTPVRRSLGLPPRHSLGSRSPAVAAAEPRCAHCEFAQFPFCPVTGRAHRKSAEAAAEKSSSESSGSTGGAAPPHKTSNCSPPLHPRKMEAALQALALEAGTKQGDKRAAQPQATPHAAGRRTLSGRKHLPLATPTPQGYPPVREGSTSAGSVYSTQDAAMGAKKNPAEASRTLSMASSNVECIARLSFESKSTMISAAAEVMAQRKAHTAARAPVDAHDGDAQHQHQLFPQPQQQLPGRFSHQSSISSWQLAGNADGRSTVGFASCCSTSTEPQSGVGGDAPPARMDDTVDVPFAPEAHDEPHEHSLDMSQDTDMDSDSESGEATVAASHIAPTGTSTRPSFVSCCSSLYDANVACEHGDDAMPPPVGSMAFVTTPNARAASWVGAGPDGQSTIVRRSTSRSCSEPGVAGGNLVLMTPECRAAPLFSMDAEGCPSAPDAPARGWMRRERSTVSGCSAQRELSYSSSARASVRRRGSVASSAHRSSSDPGPGLVLAGAEGHLPPAMRCSMHLGTVRECVSMTPDYRLQTCCTPAWGDADRRGSAPHAPARHARSTGTRQASISGGSSSGWQPRELRFSSSQQRASSASSGAVAAPAAGVPHAPRHSACVANTPRVVGLCYHTPDPRVPSHSCDMTPSNPPPPFHSGVAGAKETPAIRFTTDSDNSAPDAPYKPRRAVSGSGAGGGSGASACSVRSSLSYGSCGCGIERREALFAGGADRKSRSPSLSHNGEGLDRHMHPFHNPFAPAHERGAREMSLGSCGSGDAAHMQFYTITDGDAGGSGPAGSPQPIAVQKYLRSSEPPAPPGRPRAVRDTVGTSVSVGSAQRELFFVDGGSSCGGGSTGSMPPPRGAWGLRESLLTCHSSQSPAPMHPFCCHETPECSWTMQSGPPGAPARGPGSGNGGYVMGGAASDRACSLSSNAFISPVTRMGGIRRRIHARCSESEASCYSHEYDDELLHMPARSESASTEDSFRIRHSIVMYTPPPI